VPAAPPLVCSLDNYNLEAFAEVAAGFGQAHYGYVVTPNVDHLIRLHSDPQFRRIYLAAQYVLLDSQFLAHLLRMTRNVRLPVCTGSDLTARLLADVAIPNDRIVVIGGNHSQIAGIAARYGLKNMVQFAPPMGFIHDPDAVEKCLCFIEAHSPFRFCLLAVGAPQQEMLAERLQARGVALGLALCVGASIDFISGSKRRAPKWMRAAGIEWLFRLGHDPATMAKRYLLRGPRVFRLLCKTTFVVRAQPAARAATTSVAQAA
jgi:exopolysaccharide biosynthesis WecB/TagA/CpsF family protein